uniref:TNFR-Cys domain-containing protein n=1 Tax=Ciona savignyi TaxID=51511 RepID=H2Z2E2_CIOSA
MARGREIIFQILFVVWLFPLWNGVHASTIRGKSQSSQQTGRSRATIQAAVVRAYKAMKTNEYRCDVGQYYAATGSCEDCVDLCENWNEKMCQVECPATYVKMKSEVDKMQEEISSLKSSDLKTISNNQMLFYWLIAVSVLIGMAFILGILSYVRLRRKFRQVKKHMESRPSEFSTNVNSPPPSYTNEPPQLKKSSSDNSLSDKDDDTTKEKDHLLCNPLNQIPPQESNDDKYPSPCTSPHKPSGSSDEAEGVANVHPGSSMA